MSAGAVSHVVATIREQLAALGMDGRDARARGLRYVAWDESTLKVSRGERGVLIRYNSGTDLYDLEQYEGLTVSPLADGVYADNLLIAIKGAL